MNDYGDRHDLYAARGASNDDSHRRRRAAVDLCRARDHRDVSHDVCNAFQRIS